MKVSREMVPLSLRDIAGSLPYRGLKPTATVRHGYAMRVQGLATGMAGPGAKICSQVASSRTWASRGLDPLSLRDIAGSVSYRGLKPTATFQHGYAMRKETVAAHLCRVATTDSSRGLQPTDRATKKLRRVATTEPGSQRAA